MLTTHFVERVNSFVQSLWRAEEAMYASVLGKQSTLYGTAYGLLTRHYLGVAAPSPQRTLEQIQSLQDPTTGFFVGPELQQWSPSEGALHGREHLLMHLTCTALPVLAQFGAKARHPLHFMKPYVDLQFLQNWLDSRDLTDPWYEGNNLLFIGQLLTYLRDFERTPGAQDALDHWFAWHDAKIDRRTGLWGSDCGASDRAAMCGGYHQLLVYYHERRVVQHPHNLVDTVLNLQCVDGGFAEYPGGGACEDVDAVDILVNMYKQHNYRRPAIRSSLRRCRNLILSLQNPDGGFPYKKTGVTSHMGIPDTTSSPGGSTMFATWFRVHTLALISEILTDTSLGEIEQLAFSNSLSMGWHQHWARDAHVITLGDRLAESLTALPQVPKLCAFRAKNVLRGIKRRIWHRPAPRR